MNKKLNKNSSWWKRFFSGFGATSTRVRKRKRGLRVESLEARTLLTINLAAADLSYLLEQVQIGNDYDQLSSPLDPLGVREVSGANNNLVGGFTQNPDGTVTWNGENINPDWGAADTDFLRIFTTDHPNNGTSYGFTFDPVTMHVIESGDGTPILGADGQPLLVPADLATQFAEAAIPSPGTSPRTITQLIANSDVDPTSPTYNPAAAAAMEQMGGEPVDVSNTVVGSTQTAFIPNPGILGGVPYNEFFVEFGQFFDHGLDFITKGGGYVLIPLSPSDPLYDPSAMGPTANMMMLSRGSLSNPASDFNIDGSGNAVLRPDAVPAFNNNTGLMIDQSQTYGSHSAINVLVRQYDADGNVTGNLITSAEDMTAPGAGATPEEIAAYNRAVHDLATFADMKVNAARLGIALIDMDVLDAPMIRADGVGRITFTPQQTVMYRSDLSIGDTPGYSAANDPFVRWTAADAANGFCATDQIGTVRLTGHAILSDMGNGASPMSPMGTPLPSLSSLNVQYNNDLDAYVTFLNTQEAGTVTDRNGDSLVDHNDLVAGIHYYDDALLAAHYVSGDHRANENVGLTSMHHIFHEEHNIQAAAIKDAVTEQAALLNDGTAAGIQAEADYLAQWQTAPGEWDGEKIYQAARIIVETEYNHISIDQYVGGLVVMPEFVSYSSDINLDVSLEFSQAVFRLGHSQLTETVQIAVPNNGVNPGEPGYIPSYTSVDLFDAFLNPLLYQEVGPSGVTLGLLNQQGNEIDEFVTAALQQSLVGVPLDLPALNISRGRDVGLPTLNELRQQIFDGLINNTSNSNSNGPGIAPYTSWEDFGGHLRHSESLVNFIAAYGREDDVFGLATMRRAYEAGSVSGNDSLGAFDATAHDPTPGDGVITLQDLRANAQGILDAAADPLDPLHGDAVLFLRGQGSPVYDPITGTWNPNDTGGGDLGFWDVDLWIGGLAEQPLFDAPLGTTFTFVMADFGQRMQDGDRFYYLYRMPVGHHLGDQIIGEQFADLVMRTTGLEHIGDAFGLQSTYYTLDGYKNHIDGADGYIDNDYDGTIDTNDLYGVNDYFNSIYESLPNPVRAFVVANGSFENGILGGAPGSWDTTGTVVTETNTDGGHDGSTVASLASSATISKTFAAGLVEGAIYTLSVNLGHAADDSVVANAHLVDAVNGAQLDVSLPFQLQPTDPLWTSVIVTTDQPLTADQVAHGIRLVISSSSGTLLVDNVHIVESAPGGSANDGHNVIVGLEGNDYLIAGLGDDYVYGDAGNDVIEGAQGNDHLYGGPGDDWITDYENDDFIHGGDGNDYISAGPGVLDTNHGGNGDDEVHGGDGIDEVFGDDGDDRLYGEGDTDLMMGGDGNDYMEGGDSVDEMFGGNGNDWMRGGVGDDNINGGSGNDLLEGGLGPVANDGDRLNGDTAPGALPVIEFNGDGTEGDMDIGSYEDVQFAIFANMQTANANGTSSNLLDTYALLEGLVGSAQNDTLTGADANGAAGNGVNNYLVGGGGNDRLTGLGDDANEAISAIDYLFGDSIVVDNDLYWIGDDRHVASGHGNVTDTIENWKGTGEVRVVFEDGTLGHVLGDNGAEGADTAVYRGNLADYTIGETVVNGQQAIRITDLRDPGNATFDGIDILVGVESVEFADQTISIDSALVLDLHALDTGNYLDNFNTPSFSNSNGTTPWTTSWTETGDSGGVTAGQIRIDSGNSNQLRFQGGAGASYDGASIGRVVDLTGATSATLSFTYDERGFDANQGETVEVQFAADGVNFTTLQTIDSASGTGASNLALTGPFGANSTIRFVVSDVSLSSESVRIDDVNIAFTTPVNDASNDYATTFTEDAAPLAIASGPDITSVSPNLQSARIVLTNAMPGDALSISGALPGGIASALDLSVPGVIAMNLTGNAPLASYETAIAAVRFANTSQAPDTTPRIIQVTVNDGSTDSNTATATVAVVSVEDPAVLGNDRLLINAQNTEFVVPEWAFLANDVDPDSVLDITAIGNSNGLGTLSLTLNPGSITVSDTGSSGGSFSYTVSTSTANVTVFRDTGTMNGNSTGEILVGSAGANTINGNSGNDIILAGDGNDTIVGGDGDDRLFGEAGNDTFTYAIGNGIDTVDGGTDADVLNITGTGSAQTLDVIYDGTSLTDFEGGTIVNVESVNANLGGGTDTLSYAGTTAPIAADLATGTASGFAAIASIEGVSGGSGADVLTGSSGANLLNGGAGGDILTGGNGNDTIDTGAADDDVPDLVRWSAVAEFGDGDTVNNFDATGTAAQIDRVEFLGAELLGLFDDGTAVPDGIITWFTGDNVNDDNVPVNLNGTIEALFLGGANDEGVSSAGANALDNAGDVATEFNAEFALTAANGEATLLVINDTDANSAAIWQWVQAGGGEITSGELTRIAIINANGTVTTDSVGFDLGAPLLAASVRAPSAASRGAPRPAALRAAVQAAIAGWVDQGLSPQLANRLRQVQFVVQDLPGSYLGMAAGNTIYLDADAAGNGWFVDRTPRRSEEFQVTRVGGEMLAVDPRAVDRIDLLSVVSHELGHMAGLADSDAPGDLMNRTLSAGTRRTAGVDQALAGEAFWNSFN